MSNAAVFLEAMRPRQWTKNLILFAGAIFAQRLGDPASVVRAALGFVVFCAASGAIYIVNDVVDRELDRRHPDKRRRPVASGRLAAATAVRGGAVLAAACLAAAALLGLHFLAAVAGFFAWNLVYSRWLKRVPVLDVTGIGMSFVIRAVAGVAVLHAVAPGVTISFWLLLCTFFLSLFLGFCKRRDELLKIKQVENLTRPVLRGYTEPMLNALIGVSFGLTSMAYALYTVWPSTVAHFGTRNLIYTLPFVLVGMGRYLFLVYREERGGRPHEILLNDALLQAVVIAWVAVAVRIIGT